jgi:CDP-diacylglycerol--serine O-phosphatidyltransferase
MRTVYILPSLFTSGNLFCGVLAIALTFEGEYGFAAAVILAGLVFDFCDGVIARLQRTTSRFGMEYDSLADLVTFGVAPMVIIYRLHVVEVGGSLRTGLGVAFLFIACTALRLARYNVQVCESKKGHYSGLPSPGAAGVLASAVIAMHRYSEWGKGEAIQVMQTHLLVLLTLPLAFLMVSTMRYPALVHILRPRGKRPFIHLVSVLLAMGAMMFFIEVALFLCFAVYTAYGPVRVCYRALTRKPVAVGEAQPAEVVPFSRKKKRRRSADEGGFSTEQGER